MWGEVLVIIQQGYVGVIVDTFGRKKPMMAGLLVAGVAMALVPMFHSLFPQFFICRTLIYLGVIVILNIPLVPDYVEK